MLSQGAYSVFNAGFGVKTNDGKYDLSIWDKNLFDRRAAWALSLSTNTAASLDYGAITLIDPLTVGATLRTKF